MAYMTVLSSFSFHNCFANVLTTAYAVINWFFPLPILSPSFFIENVVFTVEQKMAIFLAIPEIPTPLMKRHWKSKFLVTPKNVAELGPPGGSTCGCPDKIPIEIPS